MTIPEALHNPAGVPLRLLVELTRHFYAMSTLSTDNPRSNFHSWYYKMAHECERRGYNLSRILKGRSHAKR